MPATRSTVVAGRAVDRRAVVVAVVAGGTAPATAAGTVTVVSVVRVSDVAVTSDVGGAASVVGVVVAGASVVATGGGASVVVVCPGSVIGGTCAFTCDAPATNSTAEASTTNPALHRRARISDLTPGRPG